MTIAAITAPVLCDLLVVTIFGNSSLAVGLTRQQIIMTPTPIVEA